MKSIVTLGTILVAILLLASCNGGGGNGNTNEILPLKAIITVPNVGATTNFSFDISGVDTVKGRYYFTDRNNKSVDVFDTKTNTFIKMITGGFAGCDTGRPAPARTTTSRAPTD